MFVSILFIVGIILLSFGLGRLDMLLRFKPPYDEIGLPFGTLGYPVVGFLMIIITIILMVLGVNF